MKTKVKIEAGHRCRPTSRKVWGITFLELLIAMVILIVVIIAILQLFDKDVEVRRQQDQMAEMQQNLRASMDVISRDVRAASSCATLPSLYTTSALPPTQLPVSISVPIAAVWMPSEGPLATTAVLAVGDTTRPDGIGLMRCMGNGIVDVANGALGTPPSTFIPGTKITFQQSLGLQDSDVGKFILFWTDPGDPAAAPPLYMPSYITARIELIEPLVGQRQTIVPETVTLGVPIKPTNDPLYATFGQHWFPLGFGGTIQNFDASAPPIATETKWKAAIVEWVEYIVDKWDDNDIPHSYSATTKEGSQTHPLLVRRVNPHLDSGGNLIPEWDVIGHDIEDMQVVWIWDPDFDPARITDETNTGLEYQAGDPSQTAQFTSPYSGFPLCPGSLGCPGVVNIYDLIPAVPPLLGAVMYPQKVIALPYFPLPDAMSPVALRKVRITLLARTRERELHFGAADVTGHGFPEIELGQAWLQGSPAIAGGPPVPPLYLSAYRRRALTSELTLRNYLAGGLE